MVISNCWFSPTLVHTCKVKCKHTQLLIAETVGKHLRMTDPEINYRGFFHREIARISKISPRFHRISSMLLDHIIMCLITIPTAVLFVIISTFMGFELNDGLIFYTWVLLISIYINKDFFNAKSPAKRIMGYQVVSRKTGIPATELQCFVRNFTIFVAWPLEVIIAYINPKRRIGDFLANTEVVTSKKEKLNSIWAEFKKAKLKTNFVGIIIIGGIYFYALSYIIP